MAPTPKIRPAFHSRSNRQLFLCPITNHPCEGDLSYLCEDYGCARKGGVSPCYAATLGSAVAVGLSESHVYYKPALRRMTGNVPLACRILR
jgi:hypothetical protein